ncbi:STAS/SEC14 domain-containing protein [Ramlibacter sp. USB13]|uniref:STAS/SEC14 domain-containing protein n=1 Tax=Ramlibacter cellulosilyticus TaxID=2764187 RepID=A0A923SH08_9BURK|nr:STAS/SEC14 domain-containing protein [Ramlibacter cellulosilyticus]MBC5785457.1 STAS/SEC14 domain-containing protein [Ramlibacter cellulosilyticus]
MRNEQVWVEPVGSVIVARIRGKPTAEVLRECERRVVELARDTQQVRVLYDALELEPPEMELVLLQQQLEAQKRDSLGSELLRTAILVSNTRIAYLARIAFGHAGEANYRVFYNDFAAAFRWLESRGA